jgi:hypothetical protein
VNELRPWPFGGESLVVFARDLPENLQSPVLEMALEVALRPAGTSTVAEELAKIAPYLPTSLLERAVRMTRELPDAEERRKARSAVASYLTPLSSERLYHVWQELFPVEVTRSRKELLAELKAAGPLIEALGGPGAVSGVVAAIRDVGS